jgi:hypothetical protein
MAAEQSADGAFQVGIAVEAHRAAPPIWSATLSMVS